MSVCMSAVSAGMSVVLIKYTGNVWLQTNSFGSITTSYLDEQDFKNTNNFGNITTMTSYLDERIFYEY